MSRFKIYNNDNIMKTLTSMIDSGRLSQGIFLYGDSGLGKKTIAEYITARLLCQGEGEHPCGVCKSCRMIKNNSHPDVSLIINAPKSKAFGVENIRKIISDAYIYPNEGEKKVYIFADCDTMLVPAQNTLLKIIEEPPPHVIFIFTAKSKSVLLSTILSRVISFPVCEVSIGECEKALFDNSITDKDRIDEAISCFGGNIGKCIDFINNDELRVSVDAAKKITDCINSRNEYDLLFNLNSSSGDNDTFKSIVSELMGIIRDCCAVRVGSTSFIGCYHHGSEVMAKNITLSEAQKLYRVLSMALERCDANVSVALLTTYLSSKIKNII